MRHKPGRSPEQGVSDWLFVVNSRGLGQGAGAKSSPEQQRPSLAQDLPGFGSLAGGGDLGSGNRGCWGEHPELSGEGRGVG